MTLSFTQTINGKPNYFIEKIWKGIVENSIESKIQLGYYAGKYHEQFLDFWNLTEPGKFYNYDVKPKRHTIRFDPHNRWRAGMNIHPVINNRSQNRFQFAPTMECKSVQTIEIKDVSHLPMTGEYGIVLGYPVKDVVFNLAYNVIIDGIPQDESQIKQLAINDGFDSVESFFDYFKDGVTDGTLIHWTPLKY